jgi:subfamily B ATP-binding cassette protein MsbA
MTEKQTQSLDRDETSGSSRREEAEKPTGKEDVSRLGSYEFATETRRPFLRLLSYVRPYRWRFVAAIGFGIACGLFNAAIISAMQLVFKMLLPSDEDVISFKIPLVGAWEFQVPDVSDSQGLKIAILLSLLIPLAILLRGALNYLSQYFMMWVGNRVLYDLRDQLFTKLLHHSLSFYSKQKTGELIQTVVNQTQLAQGAGMKLVGSLAKHPVSILTMVGCLVYLDWIFALVALVVFPLCLVPVLTLSKKVRKAGGKEQEEAGKLMVTIQESFAGIRDVKAYAREDFEREKFNGASKRMLAFIMRWKKAVEIVGPLVEAVASLGIAAGLVYAKMTGMTAADFLIRYVILIALYPHAKALSRMQIELQKCRIATNKVFDIMDRNADVADAVDAGALPNPKGDVCFQDVSFAYKKGVPAVRGIDLRLQSGRFYALVGPSGAGKSTLFSLLLRFYDPDEGQILIGGSDLRHVTQASVRENISVVNQDTFLFHDTIETNIRYGKLDATIEEIEAVARKAHAHEFICEQDKGYQTVIGDKGHQLSGGQRQRISIARSILRDAPVLLLDEAYSALDTESEKIIQEAVEILAEGKTVIAIAHRLSTILDADEIIVMEEGCVVARGTHEELLKGCPLYKRLYKLQFASMEAV